MTIVYNFYQTVYGKSVTKFLEYNGVVAGSPPVQNSVVKNLYKIISVNTKTNRKFISTPNQNGAVPVMKFVGSLKSNFNTTAISLLKGNGYISGIVKKNDNPVSAIVSVIMGSSKLLLASTITDVDGIFHFSNLPLNQYLDVLAEDIDGERSMISRDRILAIEQS